MQQRNPYGLGAVGALYIRKDFLDPCIVYHLCKEWSPWPKSCRVPTLEGRKPTALDHRAIFRFQGKDLIALVYVKVDIR